MQFILLVSCTQIFCNSKSVLNLMQFTQRPCPSDPVKSQSSWTHSVWALIPWPRIDYLLQHQIHYNVKLDNKYSIYICTCMSWQSCPGIDIILPTDWDWTLGKFRVHSALRRKWILPLDTAWFSMVTVLPNTKTALIKGVLRRDNALSAYRL